MQYPSLTNRYKIDYSEIKFAHSGNFTYLCENITSLEEYYERGFI